MNPTTARRHPGGRLLATLMCSGMASGAAADLWTEPSPWRSEALIEGRDFDYNNEAFLQRFSFRHLSGAPLSGDDGARGTVGSVTGDEFFVDVGFQKHLHFDDDRHHVVLRLQRFEDFDNRFDRQIVGIGRRLGRDWSVTLAGDVQGNKADIDLQLEARWQPDDRRLLRLAYIRPEHFFNDKGSGGRYTTQPQTLFAHYRHQGEGGWRVEGAVNYSPEAKLDDEILQVLASGDQLRLMLSGEVPAGPLQLGARLELEHTDRNYDWAAPPVPDADRFERRMHAIEVWGELSEQRWSPRLGLRYFRFEEEGWFGTEAGTTGEIDRTEPLLYASVTVNTGERHQWQPTLYVSRVEHFRQFDQQPGRFRDEEEWLGKLAVPWRYTVDRASGAVLTVNPTFRLHRAAFGGGNVQLHWPL